MALRLCVEPGAQRDCALPAACRSGGKSPDPAEFCPVWSSLFEWTLPATTAAATAATAPTSAMTPSPAHSWTTSSMPVEAAVAAEAKGWRAGSRRCTGRRGSRRPPPKTTMEDGRPGCHGRNDSSSAVDCRRRRKHRRARQNRRGRQGRRRRQVLKITLVSQRQVVRVRGRAVGRPRRGHRLAKGQVGI